MSTDEKRDPDRDIIEVAAESVILGPGGTAIGSRILALRQDAAKILAPAVEPEMRGRRPSGQQIKVDPASIPAHMRPIPLFENPERIIVPKRTAVDVAKELTGVGCSAKEKDGYCHIHVHFPNGTLEFKAADWFCALGSLKNWLDTRPKKST